MTVYLLHFEEKISAGHTCQHYLGSAKSLKRRLAEHRSGNGARLTAVALERGISFVVARTWAGGHELEKQLKRQKNGRRLCPICNRLPTGE